MTLTVKVPRELAAKIEMAAAQNRTTKSKYVRDVLSAAVKKVKRAPSMYDLMKDGLGCFDSGKADKATNPKYLKNFGKWRR